MLRVEYSDYCLFRNGDQNNENGEIDLDRAFALFVCVLLVFGVAYSADRHTTDYDSSVISPPSPTENLEDNDYRSMSWKELQMAFYESVIDWAETRLEKLNSEKMEP